METIFQQMSLKADIRNIQVINYCLRKDSSKIQRRILHASLGKPL